MSDELTFVLRLLVVIGLLAGAYEGLRKAAQGKLTGAGAAWILFFSTAYIAIGLALIFGYTDFEAPGSWLLFIALLVTYLIAGFVLGAKIWKKVTTAGLTKSP